MVLVTQRVYDIFDTSTIYRYYLTDLTVMAGFSPALGLFILQGGICYCILIAKCISGIYLLITMVYKTSAYHFRSCIAREQCQNVYNDI